MARSADNTLLQRMGFRDPDRHSPEHDQACVSLATDAKRLLALKPRWGMREIRVALERPLQKGEGKYASTVGFIDAWIEWDEWIGDDRDYISERILTIDRFRCPKCNAISSRSKTCTSTPACVSEWGGTYMRADPEKLILEGAVRPRGHRFSMLVEIKTKIDSISDLLRQMNLYREYQRVDEYVVWSLAEADLEHAELLESQGYCLVVGASIDRLIDSSPSPF